MSEIVAIGLHRQAINADGYGFFLFGIPTVFFAICVITCFGKYAIGNEILAGTIAFYDGFDEIFRHILIVGKELLGIFRQAIAAVSEGRVVVMRTDTRIETNAFYNLLGIQTFHLCVGVEFVEVADTQSEIGVCEEFHGFGFG